MLQTNAMVLTIVFAHLIAYNKCMIRLLISGVCLVIFLLLSIPTMAVEWIIGKFRPDWRDISSLRIVQGGFRMLEWISGCKVTEIGRENVPEDKHLLYICNHLSAFDIVLTYSRCRRLTGYMAKIETKKLPVISVWMRFLYCSFVDRHNSKEAVKSILDCIHKINDGINIYIFPEGTRNKGDQRELLPFKSGAFRIATKTNCVIQPVAISNTSGIFEDHLPWIKKQDVVIEYLPAIDVSLLDKEQKENLAETCREMIMQAVIKNTPADYVPPAPKTTEGTTEGKEPAADETAAK